MTPQRSELIESIRKRPLMYLGSADIHAALLWLLTAFEAELLDGRCRRLVLAGSGPGRWRLDVEGHPWDAPKRRDRLRAYCEGTSWSARSRGQFGEHGLAVVNAISSRFDVHCHQADHTWTISFADGATSSDWVQTASEGAIPGVSVVFELDPTFIPDQDVDPAVLESRLDELAARRPGAELELKMTNGARKICFHNGWGDFIQRSSGHGLALHQPFVLRGNPPNLTIAAALQWTTQEAGVLWTWVNGIRSHAGSHFRGMARGIADAVSAYAYARGTPFGVWRPTLGLPGLRAALDLETESPRWAGSIKGELEMPQLEEVLAHWIKDEVGRQLAASPQAASAIIGWLRRIERSYL